MTAPPPSGASDHPLRCAQVCVAGYSTSARAVSQSGKDQVYAEYSITSHPTGAYEIDHLIALELGGSNDIRNLWPEPYGGADNAHIKDAIENTLHADVCAGRITLAVAQREIVVWDDVTRSYPSPELTPTATDAPSTASTTTQTTAGGLPTIKPGAYCTPIGAYGTYNGLRYLCATTNAQGVPYSGGRAHWRQG
jgi:hypothetical protein